MPRLTHTFNPRPMEKWRRVAVRPPGLLGTWNSMQTEAQRRCKLAKDDTSSQTQVPTLLARPGFLDSWNPHWTEVWASSKTAMTPWTLPQAQGPTHQVAPAAETPGLTPTGQPRPREVAVSGCEAPWTPGGLESVLPPGAHRRGKLHLVKKMIQASSQTQGPTLPARPGFLDCWNPQWTPGPLDPWNPRHRQRLRRDANYI